MHKKIIFFIALVFLASKLLLMGKGFLGYWDELYYLKSINAISHLLHGQFRTFLLYIFIQQARAGDGFLKLLPAAFQLLINNVFHIKYYQPLNYCALFIYNFSLLAALTIVHFKFLQLFLKSTIWSLTGTILLLSMMSFSIYLRHALPYDESLLVFYFATYFIVKKQLSNTLSNLRAFITGVIAFGGFSIYSGYYPYVFLLGLIITLPEFDLKKIGRAFQLGVFYVTGFFLVLLAFECLSRLGWCSYIGGCLDHSKTILMGDFDDSYIFPIKYLINAEGPVGYLLLCLTGISLIAALVGLKHTEFNKTDIVIYVVFSGALACLLGYATLGFVFKKMVFYARLLHMYFPLFIIINMFFLKKVCDSIKLKELWVIYAVMVVCVAGYFANIIEYKNVFYPRDVAYLFEQQYNCMPKALPAYRVDETVPPDMSLDKRFITFDPRIVPFFDSSGVILPNDSIVIVTSNTSVTSGIETDGIDKKSELGNYKMLANLPSYENVNAYKYEGLTKHQRSVLNTTYVSFKCYVKR